MTGGPDWWARADAARAGAGDPALDFCLWPYDPPRPPAAGALRSEALLHASFAAAGAPAAMAGLVDRLRDRWGPFATVWGMKWGPAGASWEFYFYDYDRERRRHGIADFRDATAGLIRCDLPVPDHIPYFMFSVEIGAAHLAGAPLDQIDLYIGNPGSTVSSGICYGLTAAGRQMRNFYFFFDAAREAGAIRDKLTESAHLDLRRLDLDALLWPEMAGARTVVVANKQARDGLYFSRIGVDALAVFLRRLTFPAPLIDYLERNRGALAHHLFDVGWDYDVAADGGIVPVKGSIYGTF